jgi:hypothetical protein
LGSVNSRSTDAELTFVETELRDRFHEEYAELRAMQKMHRTDEEFEFEESEPGVEKKGTGGKRRARKQARKKEQTQDPNMQDHEGGGQVGETSILPDDEQVADKDELLQELEYCLE